MSDTDDAFPPPADPVEVHCIECGWTYMSDLMVPIRVNDETHWMCPVPGCGALGYMFDILPTNPEDAAPTGSHTHWSHTPWSEDDELDLALTDSMDDASLADAFDPPTEWTPESDRELEEALEDIETQSVDASDEEERYFTREDYEQARADGVYDRAADEIRQRWSDSSVRHDDDHGELDDPPPDEDLPF